MNKFDKFSTKEHFKERELWLEKVSRTFTLSIKILPKDLRDIVGLSYIICRLLDTIEDAPDMTVSLKKEALSLFQEIIEHPESVYKYEEYFSRIAEKYTMKEYERIIMKNCVHIFIHYNSYSDRVKSIIKPQVVEMAEGMKKYSFGEDKPGFYLTNFEELEEYTYYVAGTVGRLLSGLFLDKINSSNVREIFSKNDIEFGKALQYVNIIKDANTDILEGRCFIPNEAVKKVIPEELFRTKNKDITAEYLKEMIYRAEKYIENSINYISSIPVRCWRIRLFCIWPVIFANKTLKLLKNEFDRLISSNDVIKINRKEVKRLIYISTPAAFSNFYLKIIMK
ncbi:MAG: squalene/phytoene synthase family protein [Candidatus Delongbacteria bacterium]|nr:squalene/phytoene synthase family protein [Candidatus Delongbacteria bacterium]MBN2834333.1 squalene/phytoene synthase family protein [Candidatus Delongbacteria bacterium]